MRNVNFSNNIAKIVRKSKRDETEIMWLKGDIKKSNFSNDIVEIPASP